MDAQQTSAWISEPRFRPFLDATGGNHQAAVALYPAARDWIAGRSKVPVLLARKP